MPKPVDIRRALGVAGFAAEVLAQKSGKLIDQINEENSPEEAAVDAIDAWEADDRVISESDGRNVQESWSDRAAALENAAQILIEKRDLFNAVVQRLLKDGVVTLGMLEDGIADTLST